MVALAFVAAHDDRRHPRQGHPLQRPRDRALRRPVRAPDPGMTSSAMRDMMAVTARPEVISLATGLPDTTTFPAEDFAR